MGVRGRHHIIVQRMFFQLRTQLRKFLTLSRRRERREEGGGAVEKTTTGASGGQTFQVRMQGWLQDITKPTAEDIVKTEAVEQSTLDDPDEGWKTEVEGKRRWRGRSGEEEERTRNIEGEDREGGRETGGR